MSGEDEGFIAMRVAYDALEPLEQGARERVFSYVGQRLGLVLQQSPAVEVADISDPAKGRGRRGDAFEFAELGELFDAFDPKTDVEKALVAAFWCVEIEGEESFDSQRLNSMLKNLGHGVANITRALGGLSGQKPALVIQTRKSGTSRQARKTYKITRSGVELVRERISKQSY